MLLDIISFIHYGRHDKAVHEMSLINDGVRVEFCSMSNKSKTCCGLPIICTVARLQFLSPRSA